MLAQILKLLIWLVALRLKRNFQGKVLLIGEYSASGGTRTYFIYLLHFLHKQGYNVTVLINSNNRQDETINRLLQQFGFEVLPVVFEFWCIDLRQVRKAVNKEQLIRYQIRELQFWCRLQRKHQFSSFIFTHNYPEQYLYSFLLPVSICYILHTVPEKRPDKYKELVLKLNLGSKKQIITVSASARKAIEHYWLQNQESRFVQFVYNYYEPKFNSNKQHAKTIKTVLTIGSVETYKNPLFFVETAKAVIENDGTRVVRFIWAGDGTMLQTCREAVSTYPQIEFIGHSENVEDLYDQAYLYFQPSLIESHGIAVLGAMYHHLPCVVSNVGGLKESVKNEQTGFVVEIDDINLAVKKIIALLDDRDLNKSMGDAGYIRYQKKFSKEVWEKNMVKKVGGFI